MSLGDITSGPGAVFTNSTNPPVTTNEELIRELAKVISDPGSVLPRAAIGPYRGEYETVPTWAARAVLVSLPRLGATVDTGPSPAEEAVKRVEALLAAVRGYDTGPDDLLDRLHVSVRQVRAALASPAPAPQGEEEDRRRRGFDCPTCKGIGRTFHSDMPDGSSRAQGCLACDGTGRSAR